MSEAPELYLSNQLCFLVYRLEREITARYRPLLEKIGLTYPQYLVMLVLWEEEKSTVGNICTALGLDTGTVSPLLKRLEARGLLQRTRDKADERTVLVSLTPAGRELKEEARAVPLALASCLGVDVAAYRDSQAFLQGMLAAMEGRSGSVSGDGCSGA